jgi:hypothetical protein
MSTPRSTSSDHLGSQVIDESGPGTVLRDFETLLEFVGLEGVRSTGKYHLLPLNRLFELDERLTHPLRPRLQRPKQQSFPHINGLYLMLRATQLGVAQGGGKKTGKLLLEPAVLKCWRSLNATERYFTLLEAWLRHASWEMVGGRDRGWMRGLSLQARELWQGVPAKGLWVKGDGPTSYLLSSVESFCTLALLELFGLFAVQREEPTSGESWRVTAIEHTAFGDELLTLAFEEIQRELFGEAADFPAFGAWQPRFQQYFPEWRSNLELPEPEFRDGDYFFKVSLGDVWRRIAISAKSDLEEFAQSIIRAFEFDGDHLYRFDLRHRDGSRLAVDHPHAEDAAEIYADEFSIGFLPLAEHETMEFLYDYGENWRFAVKLEKVDPPSDTINEPTIVESHGAPPPEYDFER